MSYVNELSSNWNFIVCTPLMIVMYVIEVGEILDLIG